MSADNRDPLRRAISRAVDDLGQLAIEFDAQAARVRSARDRQLLEAARNRLLLVSEGLKLELAADLPDPRIVRHFMRIVVLGAVGLRSFLSIGADVGQIIQTVTTLAADVEAVCPADEAREPTHVEIHDSDQGHGTEDADVVEGTLSVQLTPPAGEAHGTVGDTPFDADIPFNDPDTAFNGGRAPGADVGSPEYCPPETPWDPPA